MELKINYKKNVKFYNTARKPRKQAFWTLPIIWSISYIFLKFYKVKIDKSLAKNIKPPYLLLCNHNQFLDFMVSAIANFPYRINNIVSIDGFNISPWLLRAIGSIPKRKFTNDFDLIKNIDYVIKDLKNVIGLYPEARYSFTGATSILPDSLGKLIKLCNTQVVVLIFNGHHLQMPAWAIKSRKTKLEATMKQLLSKEEVEKLTVDEINTIIRKAFDYNDYKYQKEKNILIKEPFRAEGLHKILYKCPNCGEEFKMDSKTNSLFCNECKKIWILKENGDLLCCNGETKFKTILEWYEWEKEEVRKEIANNNYEFYFEATVYSLPHPKRFIKLGTASFFQNSDGIKIKGHYNGEDYFLHKKTLENYCIHVEYRFPYLKKKDIVSISSNEDTLFFVPEESNKIQKLLLATEELYKYYKDFLTNN